MFDFRFAHRRVFPLALIIVFIVAIAITAAPRPSQADSPIIVSPIASMNLRAAPDAGSAVLATVPSGTLLTALARDPNTLWIEVNFDNMTGWLFSGYLARSASLEALPIGGGSALPPIDIDPNTGPVTAVALIDMNIRSGPGLDFPVIGHLAPQNPVNLDGKSGDGGWYRFNYGGREGWLFATLVVTNGGEANLPNVGN